MKNRVYTVLNKKLVVIILLIFSFHPASFGNSWGTHRQNFCRNDTTITPTELNVKWQELCDAIKDEAELTTTFCKVLKDYKGESKENLLAIKQNSTELLKILKTMPSLDSLNIRKIASRSFDMERKLIILIGKLNKDVKFVREYSLKDIIQEMQTYSITVVLNVREYDAACERYSRYDLIFKQ